MVLVVVLAILVYTVIRLYEAKQQLKEARRLLEEHRIHQINMYGSDFNEWYREINE